MAVSFTVGPLTAAALEDFRRRAFDTRKEADDYFEKHTCGSYPDRVDYPLERFNHSMKLLEGLRADDPTKYGRMHKGTPLFYLAWLSFDARDFERALFFLDAGISEDIANAPGEWQEAPGAKFLRLELDCIARRTIVELLGLLQAEIVRFNGISGQPAITIDRWRAAVARPLLEGSAGRTTLCALYIFLYEYNERASEIGIRSRATAGANHAFLNHLFLGGLVTESLLKLWYVGPTKFEQIFADRTFRTDFTIDVGVRMNTSARTLAAIEEGAADDQVSALTTAAKLRNATGHNLERDDIFDSSECYRRLYERVVNAIFYVINRKYLGA
jgi:hypothetical protein